MGNNKGNNKYRFDMRDYFGLLFRGQLKANERYMVSYFNKETGKVFERQYGSIEEMACNVSTFKHYNNVFVSLATVQHEKSREKENLMNRYVIGWDFDKKTLGQDFTHKDVLNKFQKVGIYYHMLVSSGRGYHAYIVIEPTEDIDKVIEITKAIGTKLGADPQAFSPTQILRVPDTFNYKDGEKRKCNVIWLQADPKKRIEYSLDRLQKRFCIKPNESNIKYVATKNMPPCISSMMEGVGDGHRNFVIGRLVKWLQRANYGKEKAFQIIKEWNDRCNPPESLGKTQSDFEHYWEGDYKLLGCKTDREDLQAILSEYCNRPECNKADKYEIIHTEKAIEIEHKIAEKMKDNRSGKGMTGNHIAIVSILKLFESGLSRKQLEEELTTRRTKRQAISKNTLTKVLKELVEDYDILETWKRGRANFYKIKSVKALESQKFIFGYGAIRGFLYGDITSAELRLYCYMRYRLSKGDNVVQEEVGRDLGIDQKTISKHIKALEEARYLIINTDYSVNRLGANVYEWIVQ